MRSADVDADNAVCQNSAFSAPCAWLGLQCKSSERSPSPLRAELLLLLQPTKVVRETTISKSSSPLRAEMLV
jgi:hypothetical protein